MFGYRSVPPATYMPSGPASAFMRSASRSVPGCRYRKDGSLSMLSDRPTVRLPDGFSIAPLPRRRHTRGLGPQDVRERRGSVPSLFPLPLLLEGLEDLLGRDRDLVHAHAHGVVHGVRHRRHHRKERALADLFRAERAVGIGVLDEI